MSKYRMGVKQLLVRRAHTTGRNPRALVNRVVETHLGTRSLLSRLDTPYDFTIRDYFKMLKRYLRKSACGDANSHRVGDIDLTPRLHSVNPQLNHRTIRNKKRNPPSAT